MVSFTGFELPQINYGMCNGKKYSVLYGVTAYLLHGKDAVCLFGCLYLICRSVL